MGEGPIRATLLNAVTATGLGNAAIFQSTRSNHSLQVVLGGTVPATEVKVTLRGSLDGGTTFNTIGTWDMATGQVSGDIISVGNAGVGQVLASLDTLTGGTSPTVTAYYVGKN